MNKYLLFLTLLLTHSVLQAEHCWMTGDCLNKVGYVVVPESHYTYKDGAKITVDNKSYSIDSSDKIFKENGKPKVNDILTINTNYYELLGTYDFNSDLKDVEKTLKSEKAISLHWSKKKFALNPIQYAAGNQMSDGTKVKVLNIQLLSEKLPKITKKHLLLKVQIVEEPK